MARKRKAVLEKEQQNLKIEYLETKELKRYERNVKIHTKKQIEKLKASIRRFGMVTPLIVDKENTIIAGHGRFQALEELGYKEIPVIRLEHLSETEVKAYRLADNKIAEDAFYDSELLKVEIENIMLNEDFLITDTGFDISEIDAIVLDDYTVKQKKQDKADEVKTLELQKCVKAGDIWKLGTHLLLCGDATNKSHYQKLMQNDKASLIITDPPYNVPISGHVCKTKHDEFEMASGEMTKAEFEDFSKNFMQHLVSFSKNGSLHYIFIDWRGINTFLNAGATVYSELKNICVWNKLNGGMGSMYRSQHEFICVFKNGDMPHVNNIELGKNGRYRTNIWEHAGISATNPKSLNLLKMHPTVKPVGLLHEIILDASKATDIVLDPFGGSGSTLLACQRAKRKARIIEISPHYCDLIIHRFEELTGIKAEFVINISEQKEV